MPVFSVGIVEFALTPLGFGLLAVLFGLGLSVWKRGAGTGLAAASVLFLWICGTPWMGDVLIKPLEEPFPPQPAHEVPDADAIVVLSHAIKPAYASRVHPDLINTSDRLWHAARLYHEGVASTIIVSGATAPVMETGLTGWDVPADSILLEPESQSTRENALFTTRVCRNRGIDRVVLVTSAWHMRRALGAFRSAGLEVVPAPIDYQGIRRSFPLSTYVPDVRGLTKTTKAVHEYLGYEYYRWRGWIE